MHKVLRELKFSGCDMFTTTLCDLCPTIPGRLSIHLQVQIPSTLNILLCSDSYSFIPKFPSFLGVPWRANTLPSPTTLHNPYPIHPSGTSKWCCLLISHPSCNLSGFRGSRRILGVSSSHISMSDICTGLCSSFGGSWGWITSALTQMTFLEELPRKPVKLDPVTNLPNFPGSLRILCPAPLKSISQSSRKTRQDCIESIPLHCPSLHSQITSGF